MAPINQGMITGAFGGMYIGQGAPQTVKIKILDEPDYAKYGGQFEGSYGLDVGWRNLYTDMAKTSSDHYGESMTEQKNPDQPYKLEAEGGETIYKPGDHTMHNINGPSHAEGGVKLTNSQASSKTVPGLPSFIFSQTKSMAIKDPAVLEHFGMSIKKKGGVVPADISKKFQLNEWKAILEDPNTDNMAKKTAAMMMDKNEQNLALLAAVQEQMKGNEIPDFAKDILGLEEGENNQPNNGDIGMYGGSFRYGGLAKFLAGGPPTIDDVDPLLAGQKGTGTTPTGKGNDYNMPPEYLEKWDKKIPGIKKMSNSEAQSAIYDYMLKNHPEKIREMWKEYGLTTKGRGIKNLRHMTTFNKNKQGLREYTGVFEDATKLTDDQLKDLKEAYADNMFGRRQMELPDDVVLTSTTTTLAPGMTVTLTTTMAPGKVEDTPKYICVPEKGGFSIQQSTVGYDTEAEARANCGKAAKAIPFDFLGPDKLAMLATAAVFPKKDYPTIANRSFEPGRYALEDWAANAANAYSQGYQVPSEQLAAYTAPQGLASNLMGLSGQAFQNIAGNIVPGVTSRNVGVFNQAAAQDQQRKDAVMDYNAKAQVARDEGRARTEQMYQQELSDYLTTNAQQYGKAWDRRQTLYDSQFLHPSFIKDPRSGKTVFAGTTGNWLNLPGTTAGGNSNVDDDLATEYNTYYDKAYKSLSKNSKLTEDEKKERADWLTKRKIAAGKTSTTSQLYSNKKSKRSTDYEFED